MRLIVCGGKIGDTGYAVRHTLDALHGEQPITLIIEPGDLGAARIARGWAIQHRIAYVTHEADWDTYGNRAYVFRNHHLLHDYAADGVLIFPGPLDTGHMAEFARKAGVTVYEPFS